jgi:hypothetical protein
LNQLSDRRLAWQPDIYQRYSLLARLTDILCGEASDALTLLDVGSGPVAVTEAFVSPRFEIVRADAGRFDDPPSSGCIRASRCLSRTQPSTWPSRSRCWNTCRRRSGRV